MCVCCKLKRLMVHYVYPNPFKLRLRTECWSSRSVPLFIKRQASKRGKREEKEGERGKKKRKERKASHHCRSWDVLWVHPPSSSSGVVEDVVGCMPPAVGLAMPLVPYDGPFQLGQGLLPGRRCLVSCAMHMLYWLCFSLCMMVMEGHSWRGGPKTSLSKVANSWFLHCACKQHVFVMQLFRRALQCRFLLWGLHKVVTVLFH